MTSEAPKLLPCPFCGSDRATIMIAKRGDAHRIYPLIRCGGCYIDVPGGNDDYSHDAKTAIRAWNTRDTTHALAMVAAAYGDAANTCAENTWRHEGTDAYSRGLDRGARDQACADAAAIRARTPDDAQAALDALLRAERVKALREAMQIADECDSLRTKMAIKAAMGRNHE